MARAGLEERDVRLVFLGVDPAWDSLRGDARFIGLLQRLNLEIRGEGAGDCDQRAVAELTGTPPRTIPAAGRNRP